MSQNNHRAVKDIALMGVMLALLFVGKRALDFLPNVEVVTLFFMLYAKHFGKKTLIVSVAFTALETLIFGIQVWVIMYLYIWPVLIIFVLLMKDKLPLWAYAITAAVYGLFFGAMCAIPYLFIGGPAMAFTWWVAGIPYDVLHCVSNFVIALVLFKPLDIALTKVREQLKLG